MLQTEHQQFQEPEYPAFPVVFQRELEQQFDIQHHTGQNGIKKTITVPQHDAAALLRLSSLHYQKNYSYLFTEHIENSKQSIQKFLKSYVAIDATLVSQLKQNMNEIALLRLGSNKIYIGMWDAQQSKCHGPAIIIFKNGKIYQGHMFNNKRHGKGCYVQPHHGWYKGNFKDDLKNGHGIEVFYERGAYQGNFLNGLRHDDGLYIDRDNNIYHGSWKLGIIHGKGTLKNIKSAYNGNFVNWLKHGTGQQHFNNGDIYRGEYQNGRFDGIGAYQWKNNAAFYEGNFKNGLRHGKGKWSKGETRYNGGYSEGLKQGYGQLYFPSGNFYKGNFIQDKKQGYGQMFWTDSSFYKGQWLNGTQNGKGQIYLAGGDIISGIFENSMLVQVMPSIYQKQMQISHLSIQDLFSSKQKIQDSTRTRNKAFSQSKALHGRKKLAKIEESTQKKKVNGSIHNNMYFKSPDKSDHHSHNAECKCAKRLENFRLKQQRSKKNSSINNNVSSYGNTQSGKGGHHSGQHHGDHHHSGQHYQQYEHHNY